MRTALFRALPGLLLIAALGCHPGRAAADAPAPSNVTLKPNQTLGFGDNRLLVFTYTENFDCVDQPHNDRNYNGVPAESDPGELQMPICQVGAPSSIDPTGIPVKRSEPLYVLVPMFSLNNDTNPNDAFTPALGATLIKLFGAVPEALKLRPLVDVQCPDPGAPPGSCTMHGDLDKPGPLDELEWDAVKRHAQFTEDILRRVRVFGMLAPIAGAHHERPDGKGYPKKLRGSAIALETRIITVADIFDAITAERPYRGATPVERTLELMEQERDKAIDGQCLDALKQSAPWLAYSPPPSP